MMSDTPPTNPARSSHHHPTKQLFLGTGYFARLEPGIVTGAADDDPSGIGAHSQVGVATANRLLWSGLLLFPLAFAVQEACARLARVTKGLAAPVLWLLAP